MLRVGVTQFLPVPRDEKSGLLSLSNQFFFFLVKDTGLIFDLLPWPMVRATTR